MPNDAISCAVVLGRFDKAPAQSQLLDMPSSFEVNHEDSPRRIVVRSSSC